MADLEKAVRDGLAAAVSAPVAYEVPAKRTARLVVVEQTGGQTRERGALQTAQVVAQCWAETRRDARALCDEVAAAVPYLDAMPEVARARVASCFRDRDMDSGSPRYQLLIEIKSI